MSFSDWRSASVTRSVSLLWAICDAAEEVFQEGSGVKRNLARNRELFFEVHDVFTPFCCFGYHDENRLTRKSFGINK